MKKLTKSKRDTVRFLLKRALNDLKVAKDFTFKAYGSSETTFDIKFAILNLESALSNLPQTKFPKKTDASPADGQLLNLVKAKIAAKEDNPPSGEDIKEKFFK